MKPNSKKILITLFFLSGMLFPMSNSLAQPINNSDLMTRVMLDPAMKPDNSPGVIIGQATLDNPGSEAAFGNYLLQIIAGGLITVAAPVAIIIIAIAGLIATVSHGDQGLIDKSRKALTWAIIGLIVIIFSWVIVKAVISVVLMSNQAANTTSSSQQSTGQPVPATEPTGGSEVDAGANTP